ncbi:hypothetical protein GCM10018966_041630 [Streptomyces yanii]
MPPDQRKTGSVRLPAINGSVRKKRTAADGAVYVFADGTRYRRAGGAELQAEAEFQRRIADLNERVPTSFLQVSGP